MTPKCSDQKCIYAFIFPQNVHLESHIIIIDNEENNIYKYIYLYQQKNAKILLIK